MGFGQETTEKNSVKRAEKCENSSADFSLLKDSKL